MTTEIVFLVEEAPDGGYTARALTQAIFTEGETPEELESNARDAVRCHFSDEDLPKVIRLHYVRDDVIAV
jgi:predicted RNase H-like HicB family nuclease